MPCTHGAPVGKKSFDACERYAASLVGLSSAPSRSE